MNRMKGLRCLSNINETSREISTLGASFHYHVVKKHLYGILDPAKSCIPHSIQSQRCLHGQLSQQECFGHGGMVSQECLILGRNLFWIFNLPCSFRGNSPWSKQSGATYCHYGNMANNEPHLSRNFLARLWVAAKKMLKDIEKRRRKRKHLNYVGAQESFQHPFVKSFSGSKVTVEESNDRAAPVFKQPPVSQSVSGFLQPTSPEEARVAPLLARSNLLITRDIEWADLVFGFEQENRYAIVDVFYPQSPVGFIREQSNVIARQYLKIHFIHDESQQLPLVTLSLEAMEEGYVTFYQILKFFGQMRVYESFKLDSFDMDLEFWAIASLLEQCVADVGMKSVSCD
ncbi:hypothetical protein CRYUN_Cryun35bG0089300 [Craigia yunnanensis]